LRPRATPSFPTRRSSDLHAVSIRQVQIENGQIKIAAARQAAGLAQRARAAHRTVAEHREIRQQRLELEVVIDDKNPALALAHTRDRKSTRLNSSHVKISY